jgi:molybdopterin molybdotransferase
MTKVLQDDCFRTDQKRMLHHEAIARLRAAASPLDRTVIVPLAQACGRTLAEDVIASNPVPAHTNSAVDGYAYRADAVRSAAGATLEVLGRAAAGHPLADNPTGETAVRILTGAVLPVGLDTVVMQEDVTRLEASDGTIAVKIPGGLKLGANVRKAGEDVASGSVLFARGHRLRPQDLAALASIGRAEMRCFEPIRIGIVSTGDEVRPSDGAPLLPGQVYDANAPMLAALAATAGAAVQTFGIWPDRFDEVAQKLSSAAEQCDLILTSGGASLGDEDHMSRALAAIGTRHMWQIAIKPGRPMMFGHVPTNNGACVVVGLPGNPVAVFVCYLMYVHPMIAALGGGAWSEPHRYTVPAGFAFSGRKRGRREFWRGRLANNAHGPVAEKFARDGSGLISGLRWADGLIDIPEDCGDIAVGDPVAFIPFGSFGIVS